MADLKISQLTDGSPIQLADQIPINRGGSNFRVSPGFTIDATDIFALRNSTTTQTLRVYRTESSSLTNYERTALQFSTYSAVNYARLSVESAGTGAANIPLVISTKGTGAFIVGAMPDGGSTGGNARGANAIDIQTLRTGATQVATGQRAIAIGTSNIASGDDSTAIGKGNTAGNESTVVGLSNNCTSGTGGTFGRNNSVSFTSTNSYAFGNNNTISTGGYIYCLGNGNTLAAANSYTVGVSNQSTGGATFNYSVSFGYFAQPPIGGTFSYSMGRFGGNGDSQYTVAILKVATTDATATKLLNVNDNKLTIPQSKTWFAEIYVVARSTGGTSNAGFVRRAMIKRDSSFATSLIGSVQTIGTDIGSNSGSPPSGWAVTVTANDTDESLDIEVTGAAATSIRWVCTVKLVEVQLT